jgi:Ecdysteroid kinase-like family
MIPDRPAQITSSFLTPILHSTGVLHHAMITNVDIEPLAAGAGFNAQIVRVYLTYDQHEAEAPRSLIAKLPTVNPVLHQHAAVFQPGVKECWFYEHGVSRSPLNVPHCYYNAVDLATGESFLLLEDLAPARAGNRLRGASLEEAKLALQAIVQLHAAWWPVDLSGDQELGQLLDIPQDARNLVEQLYQAAWPQFLDRTTLEIPEDIRAIGEHLVGRISAVQALLDSSPRTLLHGDFRLENMLFGQRNEQPVCWLIDWEDLSLGNGMYDVAWFLGASLPVENSDQEQELLQYYHRALMKAGVDGYTWAQCSRDYRCAMFSSFIQGILTVTSLVSGIDPDGQLAHVLTERFMSACRRLRLSGLLP